MTDVLALSIHYQAVCQDNFGFRICLKKIMDCFKPSRQILLVTVQMRENVSRRAPVAAIDRVVHPLVFFDKCFDPCIVGQPLLCTVV